MDYREFRDYLDSKYIKIGWIQKDYNIFNVNNIIKYLESKGYLNDEMYRNVIYFENETYISKRCWYFEAKLAVKEGKDISKIINNL